MNITKDWGRIFASALSDFKFNVAERGRNKDESKAYFNKLSTIEKYMQKNSKDMRRTGRVSMDDFDDLMRRLKANRNNGIQGLY